MNIKINIKVYIFNYGTRGARSVTLRAHADRLKNGLEVGWNFQRKVLKCKIPNLLRTLEWSTFGLCLQLPTGNTTEVILRYHFSSITSDLHTTIYHSIFQTLQPQQHSTIMPTIVQHAVIDFTPQTALCPSCPIYDYDDDLLWSHSPHKRGQPWELA